MGASSAAPVSLILTDLRPDAMISRPALSVAAAKSTKDDMRGAPLSAAWASAAAKRAAAMRIAWSI